MSFKYIQTCEQNFDAFINVMQASSTPLRVVSRNKSVVYKGKLFTVAKRSNGNFKIRKDCFIEFATNYSYLMRVKIA